MNVGHFEQISDCWSLEGQPATYYRTAAARARILQADATTPGVRQYLDQMIAHCERSAGGVEPGVSPASDRRYAGRARLARSWSTSAGISPNSPKRRSGVVWRNRSEDWDWN